MGLHGDMTAHIFICLDCWLLAVCDPELSECRHGNLKLWFLKTVLLVCRGVARGGVQLLHCLILTSRELRERLGIDDSIGIAAEQAALVWACAAKRR